MATGPRYSVKFRRRREGKTDYRTRLSLLKSGMTRLVVRNTSSKIIVQFIKFSGEGDKVVATAVSSELKKLGWDGGIANIPSAYLTGMLAAKRTGGKITEAVLDIGLQRPVKGSKVFAALKGAIDAGVEIPHSEEVFPSEERIRGAHIDAHRKTSLDAAFDKVKKAVEGAKEKKPEKKKFVKKEPKKAAKAPEKKEKKPEKKKEKPEKKESKLEKKPEPKKEKKPEKKVVDKTDRKDKFDDILEELMKE